MEGVFDPKKLDRVFLNLLVNACEAAPMRDAHVTVEVRSTADRFEIVVTDNGSGVPVPIQETLFDPFVSSGKVNGTGLGLAIVSKIVSEHNGTVRVASTSTLGTTMVVTLPRSCRDRGQAATSAASPQMSLPPVA
jgi:signal transduction histidine kinase